IMNKSHETHFELILASASPRRREILTTIGANFLVVPSEIDETLLPDEPADRYVERLALGKARDIARRFSAGFVIGADTTVVLDDQILGKPADEVEARSMLEQLSGRWHEVITGVVVINLQ